VGLVSIEQTSVVRKGRIGNGDLGIWEDGHIDGLLQITQAIKRHCSMSEIQIGHGGRKSGQQRASRDNGPPKDQDKEIGGETWTPVGSSDVAFADVYRLPAAMSHRVIAGV
jgi:2,4-dienoyl-CoA reductase-like NADH-dependent reductase (Old Yellow Enzyme family)